ncbi:5-formyltetrahydrofolate cyclo-ligase [Candidatus Peregrinibacteria bacterium]|nr:MAG: 5-formyltetrahydrofolate cyclo-ligase [Candidatus Peregrinibacteria bacterium]
MTKQLLRTQFREKRRALLPDLAGEKSLAITRKLLELKEYKDATSVLFYVSMPEEVDTHQVIQETLALGKKVYLPKIKGEVLAICPLNRFEELQPGEFGILEPCEPTSPSHPAHIDLIVIPGIAFDQHGHRLGHGKGHYDRLLKEVHGFKVGLAFDEQMADDLPVEAHDVPLDLLLTDSHSFTF